MLFIVINFVFLPFSQKLQRYCDMYISDFFVVQNANGKMCNKIYFVYFRVLYFILINIKFEFPDSGQYNLSVVKNVRQME